MRKPCVIYTREDDFPPIPVRRAFVKRGKWFCVVLANPENDDIIATLSRHTNEPECLDALFGRSSYAAH